MAVYEVVLKNQTGATEQTTVPSPDNGNPAATPTPTASEKEQQKAKVKAIAGVAVAANAAVNIYTTYSNTQAGLEGNSLYQQRVSFQNSLLSSSVSTGVGIGAAFLLGGPIIGGAAAGCWNRCKSGTAWHKD
jgi:hypothetical protein